MILVTGATGTIGSEVVRQLAERGDTVRALTRDPARAQVPAGVDVVRGDYADAESLAAAMAGVDAAFLVGMLGPGKADSDAALVAAARRAGVRRVVKLSAIGTGDPSLGEFSTWHMSGEQAVRESGLEWTILRPSSFASNTLSWAEAVRAGEPVPNRLGDGRQGVIDPHDVAAVAVAALVSSQHSGNVYTLTGPELLSEPDQASMLAEALGRPVSLGEVSADAVRTHMRAHGLSDEYIDVVLRSSEFIRNGGNAIRTEDVRQVLGRAPRTYAQWVADHLAAFMDASAGVPD